MIFYVDVDDTLVRTVGTTRIPIVSVIEHVRRWKAQRCIFGARVVLTTAVKQQQNSASPTASWPFCQSPVS